MLEKVIDFSRKNVFHLILIVLAINLVLRYHTLFNDYYDVDFQSQMVATIFEMETGSKLMQSYGPTYQAIMYVVQKHLGKYNWLAFHILAFFILLITAISLYYTVSFVKNKNAGVYSALFFAFFMNCMTKDFFSFSAEMVFNVFISLSLCGFVWAEFLGKRIIYRIPVYIASMILAYLAIQVKLQAAFYLFAVFIYYVFLKYERIKYKIFILLSVFLTIALFLGIKFAFSLTAFSNYFKFMFSGIAAYLQAGDLEFLPTALKFFAAIVGINQAQFLLWYFFYKYAFKNCCLDFQQKRVFRFFIIFAIMSLIPALITLRFYPHYFIQVLPALAIGAGIAFEDWTKGNLRNISRNLLKRVKIGLIIPASAFFIYFTLFLAITKINPEIRMDGNFFVPNRMLVECIKWLKANTHENDKLAVWGDAAEVYYFARRSPGGLHTWLKATVLRYLRGMSSSNSSSYENDSQFREYISLMEMNKTAYFIDTYPAGFSDYPLTKVKILYQYVHEKFYQFAVAGKIIIYKRKNI